VVNLVIQRWHPWAGCVVHIREVIKKASGDMVRCSRDGGASGRWLELPVWMFDRASCTAIHRAATPQADLAALRAMMALLQGMKGAGAASLNARLSGAVLGSHDPNRRDAHATVDEPPSRSSARTATAGVVRTDKPQRRGNAGMALPSRRDTPSRDASRGAPDPRSRERRSRSATGGDAP
jgi:hypothetical protein